MLLVTILIAAAFIFAAEIGELGEILPTFFWVAIFIMLLPYLIYVILLIWTGKYYRRGECLGL